MAKVLKKMEFNDETGRVDIEYDDKSNRSFNLADMVMATTTSSGLVVNTMVRLTQAEYNALTTKSETTLYIIEEGSLYRGTTQMGGTTFLTLNSLETTASIQGVNSVYFSNSSNTQFTQFTNGSPWQRFTVQSSNGSTTLVHGTNLQLINGINITLSSSRCIEFQFNPAGTIAKQMG